MNKKKTIKGFSLTEALITLLIIAMCAVLTPKLFVKKYEKREYETHGTWECQMNGGMYTETLRDKTGAIRSQKNVGGSCTFKPPMGSHDFSVDICGRHAELENCNYYDGSHVLKYYPTLKVMNNINIRNGRVYFSNYAFALYKEGLARVLIVY